MTDDERQQKLANPGLDAEIVEELLDGRRAAADDRRRTGMPDATVTPEAAKIIEEGTPPLVSGHKPPGMSLPEDYEVGLTAEDIRAVDEAIAEHGLGPIRVSQQWPSEAREIVARSYDNPTEPKDAT